MLFEMFVVLWCSPNIMLDKPPKWKTFQVLITLKILEIES